MDRLTIKCDFFDNVNSKIRVRELLGAEYYVLPSVMMVEGAYYPSIQSCNERTALFFSADELRKSITSWNGRGISLMHPDENSSFNVPDVFDNHWLGFVFNANFEADKGRLIADLWISAERGKELVEKVKASEQVDISIGACGEIIDGAGVINGEAYSKQFVNIVGDHLAVLPGSKGACSWSDGCGIRASEYGLLVDEEKVENMPKNKIQAVLSKARKPEYSGTETINWGDVNKSFASYVKGYKRQHKDASDVGIVSVESAPKEVKDWTASKTLLGDANSNTTRDLIFFPVVNPDTNKLNKGALLAVLSGRGQQATIAEAAKKSASDKARSLLDAEFEEKVSASCPDKNISVAASNKGESMSKEIEKGLDEVKELPLKEFIASAPAEYRGFLMDAVHSTNARRNEMTQEILGFKEVTFCSKFLEGASSTDLEAIVATTRLASKYRADADSIAAASVKEEEQAKRKDRVVDFSVNGFSDSGEKERYMPIRKINFGE